MVTFYKNTIYLNDIEKPKNTLKEHLNIAHTRGILVRQDTENYLFSRRKKENLVYFDGFRK